jgi:tRNA dimethylallyltransferase
MKPNVIVILGPTATGKSSLGVNIAQELSGEIISADSRQVYRGLDIISGKITFDEMQNVPHHLIDIKDPWEDYNVTDFQKDTTTLIRDITHRHKVPLIVGGTGLYIDSLVKNYNFEDTPPNFALRKKLSAKTNEQLVQMLTTLDKTISLSPDDRGNPHRLIRMIEKTLTNTTLKTPSPSPFSFSLIGLMCDSKSLRTRITTRVQERLELGAVSEVENLLTLLTAEIGRQSAQEKIRTFGLGYKVIFDYLQGNINDSQLESKFITIEMQFAKRQMTWFRHRTPDIKWFEADSPSLCDDTLEFITK